MSKNNESEASVNFIILLNSVLLLMMIMEYKYFSNISFGFGEERLTNDIGDFLIYYGKYIRISFLLFSLFGFLTISKGRLAEGWFYNSLPWKLIAGACLAMSIFSLLNIRNNSIEDFTILYPITLLTYLISGLIFTSTLSKSASSKIDENKPGFKNCMKEYKNPFSINFYSKENGYLNILNIFRGILIVGNPGSGKSWFFVKPILEFLVKKGFTGLVYDFKAPELIKWVHDSFHNYNIKLANRDEKGNWIGPHSSHNDRRNLWIVNFSDLSRTHRLNPIHPRYLQSTIDANEMALVILHNLTPSWKEKEDFWAQSAIILFKSIIWFLRCEYPDQCTLPHAIAIALMPYEKVLAALKTNSDCSQMIEPLAVAERKNAEGQISGQVTSLQSPIGKLNSPELTWVLSENDFFLDLNNPEHPGLLCIGNSTQRNTSYAPVLSLISSLVMKQMNNPEKKNKIHSAMCLDEGHSLYIPSYEQLGPATSRSEKVAHIFCTQAIDQILQMYGQKVGSNVISTLTTQVFLASSNNTDSKYISEAIGGDDGEKQSRTMSKGGKLESSNISRNREYFIHADEVRRLEVGRAVGLHAETDKKFDSRFSFKPDIKEREHEHEFNPFVKWSTEEGDKSVYPSHEELLTLASAKHKFIREQAEQMITTSAIQAVLNGLANEANIFPEHFKAKDRVATTFGDPIDIEGNVISRFTGLKIGHVNDENLYYETDCPEANPLKIYTSNAGFKKQG